MADQFGVIDVGRGRQAGSSAFREKPTDAVGPAGRAGRDLRLDGQLRLHHAGAAARRSTADAEDPNSKHDMGGNIIPMLVERGEANVYDFRDNEVPGSTDRDRGYWRDVGTLDSFYEAHMDLIAIHPVFNLYNCDWPIYTEHRPWPPAKFVHGVRASGSAGRSSSMVSPGVVVSGALVENSVVSPNVRGALVGPRRGLGADGGRATSAGTRWSATRSSTRT